MKWEDIIEIAAEGGGTKGIYIMLQEPDTASAEKACSFFVFV